MKYPGWTANLTELEGKLNNIVAHLAQVERDVGSQSAQVGSSNHNCAKVLVLQKRYTFRIPVVK